MNSAVVLAFLLTAQTASPTTPPPTLVLPLTRGVCVLERAIVDPARPATFQVLEIQDCGSRLCWERYTIVDGRRVRGARACSLRDGLYETVPEESGQ